MICHVIGLAIQKWSQLILMNFSKTNAFDDSTGPENQVSNKQAEYLNAKSTQLDQDVTIIFEAQNEDSSVNLGQQYMTITVEEKT